MQRFDFLLYVLSVCLGKRKIAAFIKKKKKIKRFVIEKLKSNFAIQKRNKMEYYLPYMV